MARNSRGPAAALSGATPSPEALAQPALFTQESPEQSGLHTIHTLLLQMATRPDPRHGQRNLSATADVYSHVMVDEAELNYAGML